MSTDPEAAAGVREGDVLAGKYRVDKILGAGGMGVVVAGHHIHLDEKVAIKFLLPAMLTNQEAVARFAREARAAVKIKSEHVARISDVGTLENGAPYMVMEYLDGGDLAAWLSQKGALPVEQAVEFVLQACEAIAEAHAFGIVHRDLKPANLFVVRRADGVLSVKVLDFGISKMADATSSGGVDAGLTRTASLMGSPLYMSPEQLQSTKDVDARTDLWSLGVILYELVTGKPPFNGDSMPSLVLQIVSAVPTPLRNERPDAPDGLEAVIMKALEKDRGKRFQTIGEFATALLPFAPKRARSSVERVSGVMQAAGFSVSALALPPSSGDAPQAAQTNASLGRTTQGSGSSRTGLFIAVAAAVLALGVFGFLHLSRRPSAESLASPAAASVAAVAAPLVAPPVEPVASAPAPVVSPETPPNPPAAASPPPAPVGPAPRTVPSKATTVTKTTTQTVSPAPAAPVAPAPAPAAAPPAAPATKKNCSPNYYFDAQGNKHFKPECF